MIKKNLVVLRVVDMRQLLLKCFYLLNEGIKNHSGIIGIKKKYSCMRRGQKSSNTYNLSNFFLGNLGAVALERYVKVMIEENDSSEAYNAIVFTNGLKHVDTAEELAVLAGENLIFEKLQKQTLNSMFSSSSKWKML